jgi:hypothetical protein
MSDPFVIAVGLIGDRVLTDEVLSEVMDTLAQLSATRDADLESVRKRLEATLGVSMAVGTGLDDGVRTPWVEDIKASTAWNYWDSYKQQLKSDGFPIGVIPTLDEDTDNILTQCGNPMDKTAWRVQGLVMGDVQSGKTANYAGLISKAADTGYRVIVLLTGMIEDLRAQTQDRMDEGFVGRDSRQVLKGEGSNTRIGAGRFRDCTPNVLTSSESDFLTANGRALRGIPLENISEPVLLVMKKNKTALQNLISFLKTQTKGAPQLGLPLLLLDDEADNASVNVREDDDPTTINRLIRELLGMFRQATYVAYTATPFANVFIDPDGNDLFPRNFVYSLGAPDSYIGAGAIFSDDGIHSSQVMDILDAASTFPEKHKKTLTVTTIPPSLQDAIGTFLLSCAIRDLRGEALKHRSMLVNVTRFTDVQRQLAGVVRDHLFALTEEVKQYLSGDDVWYKHPSLVDLHHLFKEQYEDCGSSWDDVRRKLFDAIASVKVVTINQQTDRADRLNYRQYKGSERGRRVIAIGGLSLSRGLTLEGLCVSYFCRNSKAYDTLLQMGRWFGYRLGYDDLCRIWMTPDAQDWFSHIAEVVDELRGDIRRMHLNHQPPSEFGIRVRSHPGALLVTATNKMRNAEEVQVDLSFSEHAVETPFLPKSVSGNEANAARTSEFLTRLGRPRPIGNRFVWSGVRAADVADFLDQLEILPVNSAFIPDMDGGTKPLISFIRNNSIPSLQAWDVCVPQGEGSIAEAVTFIGVDGEPVHPLKRQRRFEEPPSRNGNYLKLNRQRVGEIADEKVGLSNAQVKSAEADWFAEDATREGKRVPGGAYRRVRERPLMTVHLIEPTDAGQGKTSRRILAAASIEPRLLVAISLSFPKFQESSTASVPYRLNKVYLRTLGLLDEDEGNEDDG